MSLWTPSNSWGWIASNYDTHAPSDPGVSITPGTSNSKGSYTEVFDAANVLYDVHRVRVGVINSSESGVARNVAVDIGIDPADGGSYSVIIPDLLCPGPAAMDATLNNGGWHWDFPVFIPAGAQIGARAQTNSATANTALVWLTLYGQPSHPELVRSGTSVDALGFTAASTTGTAVTVGSGSEGTYTDILGSNTTHPYWFWDFGAAIGDTTYLAGVCSVDMAIGDASNKHDIIMNSFVSTSTGETTSRHGHSPGQFSAPGGVRPYIRASADNATSDWSFVAYGVRG